MSRFFVHNHERDIKRPTKIDTLSKSYPILYFLYRLLKNKKIKNSEFFFTLMW